MAATGVRLLGSSPKPRLTITILADGAINTICPELPSAKKESPGMPQLRRRTAPSEEPKFVQKPAP
jgi:hypothetical protein